MQHTSNYNNITQTIEERRISADESGNRTGMIRINIVLYLLWKPKKVPKMSQEPKSFKKNDKFRIFGYERANLATLGRRSVNVGSRISGDHDIEGTQVSPYISPFARPLKLQN